MTSPSTTPAAVTRYLAAADAGDNTALADCFTPDATVLDEGHTYQGREAIIGWRDAVTSQWTFTRTITGSQAISDQEFRVTLHLEGNFPGGVADLTQRFTIREDLISDLSIE